MKYLSVLRIVLIAVLCASAAFAEPSDPTARREAYRTGYAAIERRDWAEAQRIFDALWHEERAYDVALHLGQAEFQLGRYRDAAEHLAFGVAHMPPGESEELRERGILALERARSKVGTLQIVVNRPSAEVHIDGVLIGSAPLEGERFVVPGRHRVEASLAGYETKSTLVEIRAGEAQELAFELVPLPAKATSTGASASQPREPGPVADSRTAGIEPRTVALITGGAIFSVATITAIVFTARGSSAGSVAEKQLATANTYGPNACSTGTAPASTCSALDNALEDRRAANRVGNVAFTIAGIAGAATIATFFLWPRKVESAARGTRVLPMAGPNTAGLLVTGEL